MNREKIETLQDMLGRLRKERTEEMCFDVLQSIINILKEKEEKPVEEPNPEWKHYPCWTGGLSGHKHLCLNSKCEIPECPYGLREPKPEWEQNYNEMMYKLGLDEGWDEVKDFIRDEFKKMGEELKSLLQFEEPYKTAVGCVIDGVLNRRGVK